MYVLVILLVYNFIIGILSINPDEVFDLFNPPSNISDYTFRDGRTSYITFEFRNDTIIRCVKDGDIILWENDEDDNIKCTDITYYINIDGIKLLSLEINNNGSLIYYHYEYKDELWMGIHHSYYVKLLYKMVSERVYDISPRIIKLDYEIKLNNPNNKMGKYNSPDYYCIIGIREDKNIIWMREEEDDVQYRYFKYYEKINEIWIEINENDYKSKVRLFTLEFRLNLLRSYMYNKFTIIDHYLYGLKSKTYIENSNIHTTEVTEGNNIIWESPNGHDKCTMAVAHLKEDKPVLVHLYIKTIEPSDGNIYYIKLDDGNWIESTKEAFYTKLEEYDQKEDESTS